jgi:hypothetical protein
MFLIEMLFETHKVVNYVKTYKKHAYKMHKIKDYDEFDKKITNFQKKY